MSPTERNEKEGKDVARGCQAETCLRYARRRDTSLFGITTFPPNRIDAMTVDASSLTGHVGLCIGKVHAKDVTDYGMLTMAKIFVSFES